MGVIKVDEIAKFQPIDEIFARKVVFDLSRLIIVIVPMINPDGVILGNSRTGASGKDLNRQFKTKNNSLFPEIAAIKKLVKTIQQTHII